MKKLIYATLMIAIFFASGTIFNSQNSLKAEQSEIQVLNPFNLLFPPTGLRLETEPGNNTPIDITWTSAGANATYKWKFGAPTINSVILNLPSNTNGTATALTVTPAAVDGILAGLGLNPGDSVSGQWAVWAYEGNDSIKSVETFNITFKRKVVLNQFNLLFPPAGITLVTSPENNTPVNITWGNSSSGATYKWKFGAPTISSVILSLASNNSGSDTMLTVTPAAVDGILAGLGLNPGDSVSGQWAVWAYNGSDSLKSAETFNITFRRSTLSMFNLLSPPSGITFLAEPNNSTPVNIQWSKSANGVTYKWKFGAPMVENTILDLPSNNNGADTVLTVTPEAVDGILAGLGVNPGDSVKGEWAVWAYLNGDSLKSTETFDITFKRDNKSGITQNGTGIPDKYALSQNYPNPFNPSTKINFELPQTGNVKILIYDMAGKEVAVLLNEVKSAGFYTVTFDGFNLSSGIYYYRINAEGNGNNFTDTKKMMLIK
ncbi:MAG: T9SS type A sorting domain-containing protein [Ignavibacteria bacterium]|nr:T9SS type A sorting domain-containing protein [Ignavibacteriota bacterium]